jgi:hypothetical protein
MGRVLHVLMNKNGLNTYPSVYNALYCWSKVGWSNHIITGGATDEFSDLIEEEYRLRGGYVGRAVRLASLTGYFDKVIVYDPQDLEMWYAARWLFPKHSYGQLILHCLELPTSVLAARSTVRNGIHKWLFRSYRVIDGLIIQDQRRAELFFRTLPRLKGLRYFLVTNSYINAIEPIASSLDWFDQLRAKSQFLVLYTGALEPWAFSEKLFDCLLKIPEATFLFSGWSQDGYAEALAARYRTANNIRFHIGAKGRAAFNYMVAHSDVGLVFYQSMVENIFHVGLSSGKMHKFLSFEKPILVNRLPSLHDFITINGFGMSALLEDFPRAIRQLAENYPTYCGNIKNRYPALCDYENEYMQFINGINTKPYPLSHDLPCHKGERMGLSGA